MSCSKIQHLIQGCLDGSATPAQSAAVDRHLSDCADCARSREETRRLLSLLSDTPARPVSAAFDARLRRSLETTPPSCLPAAWWERFRLRFEWQLRAPAMVGAGSLAVGLLAMFVAPDLGSRGSLTAPGGNLPARRQVLAAALERHQQLERANPEVNWDAVEASIELSTGSVLTE